MPTERQHARYIVSIHEADGLPRANGGNLVASVKKVLAQDSQRQLIDPYVQVSFAGLTVSLIFLPVTLIGAPIERVRQFCTVVHVHS